MPSYGHSLQVQRAMDLSAASFTCLKKNWDSHWESFASLFSWFGCSVAFDRGPTVHFRSNSVPHHESWHFHFVGSESHLLHLCPSSANNLFHDKRSRSVATLCPDHLKAVYLYRCFDSRRMKSRESHRLLGPLTCSRLVPYRRLELVLSCHRSSICSSRCHHSLLDWSNASPFPHSELDLTGLQFCQLPCLCLCQFILIHFIFLALNRHSGDPFFIEDRSAAHPETSDWATLFDLRGSVRSFDGLVRQRLVDRCRCYYLLNILRFQGVNSCSGLICRRHLHAKDLNCCWNCASMARAPW